MLNVYCSPGLTAMQPHPDKNREREWVIEKRKVRMRAEGSSTRCSFSFKCIHAIRQTPYLPEVLQKGRGRPRRWAGWREGERRWWRGGGWGGRGRGRGGEGVWMGGEGDSQVKWKGGDRKSRGFWRCGFEDDVYSRGREEREMEPLLFIHECNRTTDNSRQNTPVSHVHVESELLSAEGLFIITTQMQIHCSINNHINLKDNALSKMSAGMNRRHVTGKCIPELDQSKEEVVELARQSSVTLRQYYCDHTVADSPPPPPLYCTAPLWSSSFTRCSLCQFISVYFNALLTFTGAPFHCFLAGNSNDVFLHLAGGGR